MAQQTFNNLTGLFDVRQIINDNATDAEARLQALSPGGVDDSVQVNNGSNGFTGYVGLRYTESSGVSVMHLGGTDANDQSALLMHSFTNINLYSNDGNDTLIGRLYNDGNTALRFEGTPSHPLFVNGVQLKADGAATAYLDATGNYTVPAGGGGGTITSIAGSNGISITNPAGPTPIVDGSTLEQAAADAQADANVALGAAGGANAAAQAAQTTANQAVVDAGAAQSTADTALSTANSAQSTANSAVQTIVAGPNIIVDASDPNNPIIESTTTGAGPSGATLGHTGILSGGILSINGGDPSLFDITAGSGWVIDHSDPDNPVATKVNWNAQAAISIPLIATTVITGIGINAAGTITQFSDIPYTDEDYRQYIIVGALSHPGVTIQSAFDNVAQSAADGILDFSDFVRRVIGPANASGNVFTENGANLQIDKTEGTSFSLGGNFRNDPAVPNMSDNPALAAASFSRVLRQSGPTGITQDGAPGTLIDPDSYDNGSGAKVAVTNNDFTIQPLYYASGSGSVLVAYGQEIFETMALARQALSDGSFQYEERDPLDALLLRGYLIVAEGATDLSDPAQAEFNEAPAFRIQGIGGTASGGTNDPDAIHDNVAGEIAAITEKVTPVATDLIIIEDSADANNKKRVQVGNLPGGGGGAPEEWWMAGSLTDVQSTVGFLFKTPKTGVNAANGGHAQAIMTPNDTFNNGALDPFLVPVDGVLDVVEFICSGCAVSGGSKAGTVWLRVKVEKFTTGNHAQRVLLGTLEIEVADNASIQLNNASWGSFPNAGIVEDFPNIPVSAGELVGFYFENVGATDHINSVRHLYVSVSFKPS